MLLIIVIDQAEVIDEVMDVRQRGGTRDLKGFCQSPDIFDDVWMELVEGDLCQKVLSSRAKNLEQAR